MRVDWYAANAPQQPIVTATYVYGSGLGVGFVPGTSAARVTINLDCATGAWSASSGQSGTLSGTALSVVQLNLRGDRNTLESFACSPGNFLPGTTVSW
jgi:hypothetical protein